jgi:hypothetical protein
MVTTLNRIKHYTSFEVYVVQIHTEFALVTTSHGYILWVHMNERKLPNNVMLAINLYV